MSKPIALSWRPFYKGLMWWLFGRVDFAEREEYQEFRYKLVIVLMASAALVTGFFILGTLSAVNPISPAHQKSMIFFTASTTLLWVLLRLFYILMYVADIPQARSIVWGGAFAVNAAIFFLGYH